MSGTGYQIILCRVEREQLTLDGLAAVTGVHPSLIELYVEHGLIEPAGCAGVQSLFDASCASRLQTIERLRRDLGANLAGVSVILHLLDQVTCLRREVESLRAHV